MMKYNVELPKFKEQYFSIQEYGAVSGGEISNTIAITKTIQDAVKNGGGHVVIPSGIWLTGPIQLESNIDLHLNNGAILLFDKNPEEYPVQYVDYEGQPRIRTKSPLYAYDAENIGISGEGIIDGNGNLWRVVKQFKVTERQWNAMVQKSNTVISTEEGGMWFPTKSAYEGCLAGEPSIDDPNALEKAAPYYDFMRPVMVNFIRCNKILIEGVTIQNSPNWNVHPLFCTNLTMRNATIRTPYYAQNGDGVDIESCKYVEIYNMKFDVGDDAICIKSGKNAVGRRISGPSENIYIHDCTVFHGHGGFVVGSEMSRGVRNVKVDNCTFLGTDTGIRFKSQLGRGGVVEDIEISNIHMVDIVDEAIIFTMGYELYTMQHQTADSAVMENREDIPEFKNIKISNVSCKGAGYALKVQGLDRLPIHDITLEDVYITAQKGCSIVNGENITLKKVKFVNQNDGSEFVNEEIQ